VRKGVLVLSLAFWLSILLGGIPGHANVTEQSRPIMSLSAEFEGGRLYDASGFKVLELSGTYRQMGRQYGALLGKDLYALYRVAIETAFSQEKGIPMERMRQVAQAVYAPYPKRYRDILLGMAETSGLGLDKQVILNAIEWIPKIGHLSYDQGHCSGLAAWGPYTSDGPLVFGRNNDDDPLFKDFAKFLVVVVFKPRDGSFPVAVLNYAGALYVPTGMNSEGLFLEMNAGPWMGFALDRVSIFTTLFSFLQDFASLSEVSRAFRGMLPNLSSIVNAADSHKATSFESSLYDTRPVEPITDGLLAATNHFVGSSWSLAQLDDGVGGMTLKRRSNLLSLGEKDKGFFGPETMMKVMDISLENGGATVDGTIYQVVAVPKELQFWIKVPGFRDWTELNLAPLLGKE
jgi:hypothetical protein